MNLHIKTIFLIDDDQDDKFFFATALEEADASVTLYTAADGLDALDKLQFVTPDIILLDLLMPRMNGISFLKKIKENKSLKNIPILIYTTTLSLMEQNELIKMGAYHVYIKPQEYQETVKTISHILQTGFIRNSA